MVRYHDEDERENISWREIDRIKDRSPYAPKEAPKEREKSRRSEWVMKGTKKHQKARNDIDRFHGTDQFEAAVKAYLDQYGLPDDWSTLSLLLDYSDAQEVLKALTVMRNLYEARTPMEKQGFKAKVDILAMTSRDNDLRDFAEEILKTL
jgi:hypothetical protein